MEFFGEVKSTAVDQRGLKEILTIANLPKLCRSISSVISDEKQKGVVHCLWGEFQINREALKYGIRFTMPECPNALSWTVTSDDGGCTIVHCTINKNEHDEDFIESIVEFVNDWVAGLRIAFQTDNKNAPCG